MDYYTIKTAAVSASMCSPWLDKKIAEFLVMKLAKPITSMAGQPDPSVFGLLKDIDLGTIKHNPILAKKFDAPLKSMPTTASGPSRFFQLMSKAPKLPTHGTMRPWLSQLLKNLKNVKW